MSDCRPHRDPTGARYRRTVHRYGSHASPAAALAVTLLALGAFAMYALVAGQVFSAGVLALVALACLGSIVARRRLRHR